MAFVGGSPAPAHPAQGLYPAARAIRPSGALVKAAANVYQNGAPLASAAPAVLGAVHGSGVVPTVQQAVAAQSHPVSNGLAPAQAMQRAEQSSALSQELNNLHGSLGAPAPLAAGPGNEFMPYRPPVVPRGIGNDNNVIPQYHPSHYAPSQPSMRDIMAAAATAHPNLAQIGRGIAERLPTRTSLLPAVSPDFAAPWPFPVRGQRNTAIY